MPASLKAIRDAIAFFDKAREGYITKSSRDYKEATAAIRASGRPLATAKAIIGKITSAAVAPLKPVPKAHVRVAPVVKASPAEPAADTRSGYDPSHTIGLKKAIEAVNAFSPEGVDTIELELAREVHWPLPEEIRTIARMRAAVAKKDRREFAAAVKVLEYLKANPAVPSSFRKNEADEAADLLPSQEKPSRLRASLFLDPVRAEQRRIEQEAEDAARVPASEEVLEAEYASRYGSRRAAAE